MEGLLASLTDIIAYEGWFAFPVAFLGGVVSSISPCVLAIIPLVIGYVSGYSGGSARKAVQYSLVFTLGLTVTFVILGVIAGAMGRFFGDVGYFWNYVLPPVLIFLGLYLTGVFRFNITVPSRILPRQKALLGAFILGLFFAILAAPCGTPLLAVILTFAATRQDPLYSGGLLLAYSVGHWIIVLAAGIVTGFAQRAAASSGVRNFAKYSKLVGGILITGAGIYLLVRLFV